MRIALTADPELPVPPRYYGGIERIVDMLARNLVKRGHDVVLFAHPHSTCPVQKVPWRGRSSQSKIDTAFNAVTLTRHVVGGGFDVVHSFSRIAYLTGILPLRIPKLMSYQREISPRTTGLAHRLSRSSLEFSAISRQMLQKSKLEGRWHCVPNGVSMETYTFCANVSFNAPLVFLGRLEEIKGPHLAIEVARRTGLELVLAGNVPDAHRSWFASHVEPHIDGVQIRYVGLVDDIQKNALLGKARALLMPIMWDEPFGIVMAEALACGTPVIGFLRGAVPEVVETGTTGFVVETVEEMITATHRIAEISRAACRDSAERSFSERAVTEGYFTIYSDLIARLNSTDAWRAKM